MNEKEEEGEQREKFPNSIQAQFNVQNGKKLNIEEESQFFSF